MGGIVFGNGQLTLLGNDFQPNECMIQSNPSTGTVVQELRYARLTGNTSDGSETLISGADETIHAACSGYHTSYAGCMCCAPEPTHK